MKENEFPILKISNIDWDKDHEEFDKLPKNFELRWGEKKWTIEKVSDWVSTKFDWVFSGLNIYQIGTWESNSGCCCAGGCSCC